MSKGARPLHLRVANLARSKVLSHCFWCASTSESTLARRAHKPGYTLNVCRENRGVVASAQVPPLSLERAPRRPGRSNVGLGAAPSRPPCRYDSQQGSQSPVHGPCVRERLGYVRV